MFCVFWDWRFDFVGLFCGEFVVKYVFGGVVELRGPGVGDMHGLVFGKRPDDSSGIVVENSGRVADLRF